MRIYPFFIPHAGCPHRCVFCDQAQVTGQEGMVEARCVARDLATMLDKGGSGGEVAFYGGSFTLIDRQVQAALLEAVQPFVAEGRISGIRISTRPDALGADSVAFLRSRGVTTVELGCQSFDAHVLDRSGRGHGPHDAASALDRLRQAGMRVGFQLMPGLPGGDRTEALASLDEGIRLGPDFLRIYPVVVFEGTGLADLYRHGRYRAWTLEEAVALCAEMWRRCRKASMPVIRMGLHGSAASEGAPAVLAGPWHPAFGQLVRSRLWLDHLRLTLGHAPAGCLDVHPADLSDVVGFRRDNLKTLQQQVGSLTLRPSKEIPRGRARWQGSLLPPYDEAGPRSSNRV